MTTAIIISLCILLLVGYIFELTAAKTKIPSVILLLLLGWIVKQLTVWFNTQLPDFSPILPVLGTLGLILIVLEGSLEIELNKSKSGIIVKSFFGALIPMIALGFVLALAFNYFGNFGMKDSLTNAIPFCVISSAIAIPSVRSLSSYDREFVVYESSLSDILGVLFFNFLLLNEIINVFSFEVFIFQLLVMILISFIATVGLSYLLSKIEHHIKFVPIILIVVLIYAISKDMHLPSLIFILIFGLATGNLCELKKTKWLARFNIGELSKEVKKFGDLVAEGTFLIRALFFLLFGYLIETSEVLNIASLFWALPIVSFIFVFRAIQLKLSKLPLQPLLFVAPRGLITILLFLSIDKEHTIPFVIIHSLFKLLF